MTYEATVCKVLRFPAKAEKALPPRPSLYESLTCAKSALASRVMTDADARAWLDLDDLQRSLSAPKVLQCQACIGGGENPPQCPKSAILGQFFCLDHSEE